MIALGGVPRLCLSRRRIEPQPTGVSRYGDSLREALAEFGYPVMLLEGDAPLSRSRLHRYGVAALPGRRRLSATADGFARLDVFGEAYLHFKFWGRPLSLVAPGPPGVMHWTYPLPLRLAGWRNLYTVHDVLPLDPAIPSPVDGGRLRRLLLALAATADRFVTVSEAARSAVLNALPCPETLVTNASQAVDVAEATNGRLPAGLAPDRFFLFVGAIEHRKNLLRLIEAHARSGSTTMLVLAGPDGLGSAAIEAAASAAGALRLPYQPRADLLRLIADARALLFPSLGEGFGLPIAEAMALGTPVMTTAGGATEEVAGGATLLVDPFDAQAMARTIARLDDDAELRARLAAAGLESARAFAPLPFARRMSALYAETWRG